jgi:hypothetical protein
VVAQQIDGDKSFDRIAIQAIQRDAVVPDLERLAGVLVDAPMIAIVHEPKPARPYRRLPFRRDYLERESRNQSLGLAGERFVANFEARRLHAVGQTKLSDRVDHVSVSQGDGLGYDVLSFEPDGRERFIEVKTTAFGAITPFYVSHNEVLFSEEMKDRFILARVHEFRSQPKIFELRGSIVSNVVLDPISYRAHF